MRPNDVIAFWVQAGSELWFAKSDAFDQKIRDGFEAAHHAAARGEMSGWEETADGVLALLLLLDQFPRNLYRGSAHAFAADPLARRIAADALTAGFDQQAESQLRPFFYLPLLHAEDLADQDRAVGLFKALDDETSTKWAELHRDIIRRFGRFPHRNAALGRGTTPQEAFLDEGGFAG